MRIFTIEEFEYFEPLVHQLLKRQKQYQSLKIKKLTQNESFHCVGKFLLFNSLMDTINNEEIKNLLFADSLFSNWKTITKENQLYWFNTVTEYTTQEDSPWEEASTIHENYEEIIQLMFE